MTTASDKIIDAARDVLIQALNITEKQAYRILAESGSNVLALCQYLIQRGPEAIRKEYNEAPQGKDYPLPTNS